MQRRLARGGLALASRDDVAHDDFVNLVGRNACALDGLANGDAPSWVR